MQYNHQRVLDQAEHALCAGRLGESIAVALSVPSAEASALAARAMLFLQRDAEAKELLLRALRRYDRHLTAAMRARLHCLLGASLTRLRRYDSAHIEFRFASQVCGALDDPELHAEIQGHRAVTAWCQRRLLEASELAAKALECNGIETRIRALMTLALADACSGDFSRAMTMLVKALAVCDRKNHETTLYESLILWNLTGFMRASGAIEDFAFLEARLLALPRIDALSRFIARGLDNLSMYYLQTGRLADLTRIARDLLLIGSESERVAELARLAEASLRTGSRAHALEYIGQSESIASSIDWKSAGWYSKTALLDFARGASTLAPQWAVRHLETYRTTRSVAHPIYLDSQHPAVVAEELECSGVVLAGLGKREEARNDLGEAMKLYEICGLTNRLPELSCLLTRIELGNPMAYA